EQDAKAVVAADPAVVSRVFEAELHPWRMVDWARRAGKPATPAADREELVKMFDEDQADRAPDNVDWSVVLRRDRARLARVKELFTSGGLQTGEDFHRAAMILQHGSEPEDQLLAHEFCVAALALGKVDDATKWLAAASEDRFLMNIDRPQRFATQYRS